MLDYSILRGANVRALQLIIGCDFSFDKFRDFCARFGKIFSDLASKILINLNDLKFGFSDFSFRLRCRRDQLIALAFNSSRISLQCGQSGKGNQVFFAKLSNSFELFVDKRNFAFFRCRLSNVSLNLFL